MNQRSLLGLALAAIAAAGMWLYVQRVLIPYQVQDAAAHGRPRGLLSDLYPRWVGAQELLQHGLDPYSDAVTREIQRGYYGRELNPGRPDEPKDEQRFAYPVYVVFLLAPWLKLPFDTARWMFSMVLLALTAASVPLWLRVIGWRVHRLTMITLVLLTTSSFAAVQGLKLQQLSLLVAALLALCAYGIVSGWLFAAGVCLALASIKPQLMALLAVWLMLWTLGNWKQRQNLFWGFVASLGVLAGGAEYLLPGWIPRFVAGMAAYERYTGGGSLLDVLVGRMAGTALALFITLMVMVVSGRERRCDGNSREFGLVTALVLAGTAMVIPMMAPYNHLILLPAVLLIVRSRKQLWASGRLTRLVILIAALAVFWPWAVGLLIGIASLVAPQTVLKLWAAPLWTSLAIPLAIFPLAYAVAAKHETLRPWDATAGSTVLLSRRPLE